MSQDRYRLAWLVCSTGISLLEAIELVTDFASHSRLPSYTPTKVVANILSPLLLSLSLIRQEPSQQLWYHCSDNFTVCTSSIVIREGATESQSMGTHCKEMACRWGLDAARQSFALDEK